MNEYKFLVGTTVVSRSWEYGEKPGDIILTDHFWNPISKERWVQHVELTHGEEWYTIWCGKETADRIVSEDEDNVEQIFFPAERDYGNERIGVKVENSYHLICKLGNKFGLNALELDTF